jgi:hypothetical protein
VGELFRRCFPFIIILVEHIVRDHLCPIRVTGVRDFYDSAGKSLRDDFFLDDDRNATHDTKFKQILTGKLGGKYTPYKLDKSPLVPLSEFVWAGRQKTEFGFDAISIKLTSSGSQTMTALTRSKPADDLAFVFNDVLIAVLPASRYPKGEEFVLMANLSDSQIDSIVDLINEK